MKKTKSQMMFMVNDSIYTRFCEICEKHDIPRWELMNAWLKPFVKKFNTEYIISKINNGFFDIMTDNLQEKDWYTIVGRMEHITMSKVPLYYHASNKIQDSLQLKQRNSFFYRFLIRHGLSILKAKTENTPYTNRTKVTSLMIYDEIVEQIEDIVKQKLLLSKSEVIRVCMTLGVLSNKEIEE